MEKGKIVSFKQAAELCFREGLSYAEKKQFNKALEYLNKAAQIEPFNADYQFNLATVFAELRELEKSNEILLGILKNIDPTLTECYFAIGCNYFDLHDIKKASEYFEKYIHYDPDGIFAEDAYDVLCYMKFYDGSSGRRRKGKTAARLAREGRDLLDGLKFDEARKKLEMALEIDPGAVKPRNDLAVLYFLSGDLEKAISLEKSVLLLHQENPFSLCNLAILHSYGGNDEELNTQLNMLAYSHMDFRRQFKELAEMYARLCQGTDAVDYKKISGYIRKISAKLAQKNIKWEKEWDDVIECAMQNKEFTYRAGYERELKNIWMNYIKGMGPGEIPVIRKREVWAAVLEYVYCRLHLIRVSKNSLAKKYNVSPSSISSRLKDFGI